MKINNYESFKKTNKKKSLNLAQYWNEMCSYTFGNKIATVLKSLSLSWLIKKRRKIANKHEMKKKELRLKQRKHKTKTKHNK